MAVIRPRSRNHGNLALRLSHKGAHAPCAQTGSSGLGACPDAGSGLRFSRTTPRSFRPEITLKLYGASSAV
jgi:hypothetical protein